jgi:translation initiation factor 1A
MVKNTTGGKNKNQARKNVAPSSRVSTKLRVSEEEGELYAVITKVFGGGMCNAQCIDGKNRICIIRGKFTGRGKRDNIIVPGSWVLVGEREWESDKSESKTQLNKCDLLEVYSESDKKKLQTTVNENWSRLLIDTGVEKQVLLSDEQVQFSMSYADNEELLKQLASDKSAKVITISTTKSATCCEDINGEESDIDIDDI